VQDVADDDFLDEIVVDSGGFPDFLMSNTFSHIPVHPPVDSTNLKQRHEQAF
jgi:hypothetical protein